MNKLNVSFGGQSITEEMAKLGLDFRVMDTDGEGLIGSKLKIEDRPGSDGNRLVEDDLPSRPITVSYSVRVAPEASHDALTQRLSVEQKLNGLIHRPGLSRLEFSHLDGYFMAKLSEAPRPLRLANLLQGSLVFHCPRPFRYVDQEHSATPANGQLSIASNTYVKPTIIWTTGAAVGAAWIEVDGNRLTIDTGISEGQQIRIDCERKETWVGGILEVENIHGTYPKVWDGSKVTTSPGGELSFNYDERWI